jgi:hypothetical protein
MYREEISMTNGEHVSEETKELAQKAVYLVAYLAKLKEENPTKEQYSISVRRKGESSLLEIEVEGHSIDFSSR